MLNKTYTLLLIAALVVCGIAGGRGGGKRGKGKPSCTSDADCESLQSCVEQTDGIFMCVTLSFLVPV